MNDDAGHDAAFEAALESAAGRLASADVDEVRAAHRELLGWMGTCPRARALAATAYDRVRMLEGRPQKFGTQFSERNGQRELWPVDPSTTDSERAKWGLPTLAELRQRK